MKSTKKRIESQGMSSFSHASNHQYTPSFQEVELLAYHIHQQKGGSDLENWLEAERTLKQEYKQKAFI